MSEQAQCSHSVIERIQEDHPGGYRTEWWQCKDCKTRFAPEPLIAGRSLRDWFAAMPLNEREIGMVRRQYEVAFPESQNYSLAELRWFHADTMIAERDRKP